MKNHKIRRAWHWPASVLILSVLVLLSIPDKGAAKESLPFQAPSKITFADSIRDRDLRIILSVLKQKEKDLNILDKMEEKLLMINQADIRLISSLCDRIQRNSSEAGTEIAYLLITALIITN